MSKVVSPSPLRRFALGGVWVLSGCGQTTLGLALLRAEVSPWLALPAGGLVALALGALGRDVSLAWFGAFLAGLAAGLTLMIAGEFDHPGPSDGDWVQTLGRVVLGGVAMVLAPLITGVWGVIGALGARWAKRRAI